MKYANAFGAAADATIRRAAGRRGSMPAKRGDRRPDAIVCAIAVSAVHR